MSLNSHFFTHPSIIREVARSHFTTHTRIIPLVNLALKSQLGYTGESLAHSIAPRAFNASWSIINLPRFFIVLLEDTSYYTHSGLMFRTVINSLLVQARYLSQVWDPLMVVTISLAHRRGDDLSPDSPFDSISHSTGQLCVRNVLTLRERGSFSQNQGSLFIWNQEVPSTFDCLNIYIAFV